MCFALTACGGGGSAGGGETPSRNASGIIVLSPQGTSASPYDEGCHSFNIYATEAGYSGNFTISMGSSSNYVLPSQTTDSGDWTISLALICEGGFQASTTQFTASDSLGNSASTYVTSF
jgi:hypothetical protein